MAATERGRVFLDTNVLVYLFDTADRTKQDRARSLLREIPAAALVVSAQVLGEFFRATTRRLPTPLDETTAVSAVARFSRFTVVPIDGPLVRAAIDLTRSASIAYWDALIIKAASSSACRRLLTEDLNHGQVIDGVRIENPFLDSTDGDEEAGEGTGSNEPA